jgi:hypothetical protein
MNRKVTSTPVHIYIVLAHAVTSIANSSLKFTQLFTAAASRRHPLEIKL